MCSRFSTVEEDKKHESLRLYLVRSLKSSRYITRDMASQIIGMMDLIPQVMAVCNENANAGFNMEKMSVVRFAAFKFMLHFSKLAGVVKKVKGKKV